MLCELFFDLMGLVGRQRDLNYLFLHAGPLDGFLAEMQELPDLIPELGKRLIVGQGELSHAPIVSCPDSLLLLYRETI